MTVLTGLPLVRRLQAERSPWRYPVAAGALVAASAHIPVISSHLDEAPYMGSLFIVLTVACSALAVGLLLLDDRAVYGLAVLTCGLAIVGYVATRLVAFPQLSDDVGDWAEPLGVVAIAAEALVVGGSLAALSPGRRSVRAGLGPVGVALVAGTAVAAVVLAGGVGYLVATTGSSPSATSVDAGFARDMSTHHRQAITMAAYTRDHTSDPDIKLLATDIEDEQYFQIGQMQGWLDDWHVARDGSQPEMAWMTDMDGMNMSGMNGSSMALPAGALMPGMASPAEMSRLESSTGKALDVLFLQLMLRHHKGGLPMAQYAAAHAREPYVRDLASKMLAAQTGEITEMKDFLAARGASPLPF